MAPYHAPTWIASSRRPEVEASPLADRQTGGQAGGFPAGTDLSSATWTKLAAVAFHENFTRAPSPPSSLPSPRPASASRARATLMFARDPNFASNKLTNQAIREQVAFVTRSFVRALVR